MYQASDMLFIYTETPLHAGSGQGTGAIDLPIQRERVTCYPLVQASGLKGALKDAAQRNGGDKEDKDIDLIFGAEGQNVDYAAAISIGDARLLLFPVRSLIGVFAWTTSLDALARFRRDMQAIGANNLPALPESLQKEQALVTSPCGLLPNNENDLVLEEFAFSAQHDEKTTELAKWLADHAFPPNGEDDYWKKKIKTSLVILSEDAFRDFALYGTEVVTRTKLNNETKTVDKETGALWTEEYLPTDSLLYAPVFASASRQKGSNLSAADVLSKTQTMLPNNRLQLGGNETIGRGMIHLTWLNGGGK